MATTAEKERKTRLINGALRHLTGLKTTLEQLETPMERLGFLLGARQALKDEQTILLLQLTGKENEQQKTQVMPESLNSLLEEQWAATMDGQTGVSICDDPSAGDGKVWRVQQTTGKHVSLDRERLLLAGVSPEQLATGTKESEYTYMDVKAINRPDGSGK